MRAERSTSEPVEVPTEVTDVVAIGQGSRRKHFHHRLPPDSHQTAIIWRRTKCGRVKTWAVITNADKMRRPCWKFVASNSAHLVPTCRHEPWKAPSPKFPGEALQKKIDGHVLLDVVVDKNGLAHDIRVLQPLGYGFNHSELTFVGILINDSGASHKPI
jgi:hypothetical protein